MPDGFARAAALLPPVLRAAAEGFGARERAEAEEFRLRLGRAPSALLPEGERTICAQPVSRAEIQSVLERASGSSLHAVMEQLRCGFLSAPDGIRIGVCGTAVGEGSVSALREIGSLAIRIPRQRREAGREIIPALLGKNVLILSPSGGGKTTFLRELVRAAGDGGVRVCLCDERGEIAACRGGQPQFDIGRCTDVFTAAPKAEAAVFLLRSMNPQVIAMDELSTPQDVSAVRRMLGCGVRVFATAHAANLQEARARPVLRELFALGAFDTVVCISGRGTRRYAVEAL